MLANPLVTAEQLSTSGSRLDGVPLELEKSAIHIGARVTHIAGILLRLPLDLTAQALVIFTRFWIGAEGGSLKEHGILDVSAAALYLVTKTSAHVKTLRSIINVFGYLKSLDTIFFVPDDLDHDLPEKYFVSEGTYFAEKLRLIQLESVLLRTLGFQTHVSLPYTICINYLQTLGAFDGSNGPALAQRAFAHLNSALLSPQLLYLTHQPPSLATAAIYLAAKEVGVKLPDEQWWEVFDTDREELGFLVVAMISMEGFVRDQKQCWHDKEMPFTVQSLERAIPSLAAD